MAPNVCMSACSVGFGILVKGFEVGQKNRVLFVSLGNLKMHSLYYLREEKVKWKLSYNLSPFLFQLKLPSIKTFQINQIAHLVDHFFNNFITAKQRFNFPNNASVMNLKFRPVF